MRNILKVLLLGLSLSLLLTACSDDNSNIVQGYIEGELTYIASSQSGELNQLSVHRGQVVKVDQRLFQLDQQPQSDQLAASIAQLASVQSTLEDMRLGERPEEIAELEAQIGATQAAIDYYQAQMSRYKDLSTLDYASKSDYDQALYEYQQSTADLKDQQAQLALASQGQRVNQLEAQAQVVEQNAANVEQAKWDLAQKSVRAEMGGFVFDTYYWPGEWVAAGQPVLSVQSPENIRVIFFVPETQLGKIQVGDQIAFQCDSCHNPTLAKISYISNQNEYSPPVIYSEEMREKLVYEVKATINKAEALNYHPGQPVDVALDGSFS